MLRAVRMFDPVRALELGLSADIIDVIAVEIPIADNLSTAAMKSEFIAYFAAASTIDRATWTRTDITMYTRNILAFWRGHHQEFPVLSIETAERCPRFAFISGYLRAHPLEPNTTLDFFLCLHLAAVLPEFRANR